MAFRWDFTRDWPIVTDSVATSTGSLTLSGLGPSPASLFVPRAPPQFIWNSGCCSVHKVQSAQLTIKTNLIVVATKF